jgi:hypothetical protein
MSTRSKAKRDARKKKSKGASRGTPSRPIVEHAHLVVDQTIVGGAGLRGGEWVLVLGGKVMAATESAAMILAMLKRVATLQEETGQTVELNYSTQLRDAATAEAEAEGKTLDDYLAELEAEREEHANAAGGSEGQAEAPDRMQSRSH